MSTLTAAEHHGIVKFGGLPVPGATVTASREGKSVVATTDAQGAYSFADLVDGVWSIQVEMTTFASEKRDVRVAAGTASEEWEMKLLPFEQMKTTSIAASRPTIAPTNTQPAAAPSRPQEPPPESNPDTADNFLINGTVNNGASSPFAQFGSFGNNRRSMRGLYNGSFGMILDSSVLDARPFSLTGQDTDKASYYHLQGLLTFGGPFKIPHLVKNGPFFFVAYQWTRNRNAAVQSALMPTLDQRNGDLSALAGQIFDPSGTPLPGNIIPASQISSQARSLLNLYPLPNFTGSTRYNYQVPIVGSSHQDSLQARFNKPIGRKNQVAGAFGLQSIRSDSPNLFEFLDTTDSLGLTTNINWREIFSPRFFGNLGYTYSRFAARITPFFANRQNISGQVGVSGNNQEPVNWGPPALNFASGIAPLSDVAASFTRNQTNGLSYSIFWGHGSHNVQAGIDYRRQQFNPLGQQDARGAFTFTGVTTHSDFASFLFGVPDTSAIAFGNADKYLRSSTYNAYINDDWRGGPEFTVNAGVRWEYTSPITEIYGRLVNLDILPEFTAEQPVVASNPIGALTGRHYANSLLNPDKGGFEPRVGLAWRPIAGSSMVVRAGYGVYYNTSVYQTIAMQMSQQAPLSKSFSVQNSVATPLTLANGFNIPSAYQQNTFAVNPDFRIGYAQNWQASVQRDFPGALVITATYLGIKGTRGMQEFLPNTYPIGAIDPCPTCPAGYVYLTSNGNSTREAGQIQLRRRLHNGFTATLQYTYSKSIDDVSSLGGQAAVMPGQTFSAVSPGAVNQASGSGAVSIAQNWLNLSAERALSNFDQRHLLSLQGQYTTGMGIRGGTLLNGWRGSLFKEWTVSTQINAGSGLPLSPIYFAPVQSTGFTGTIRPDNTGAQLYSPPPGFYLNPAAFVPPAADQWGNAGRNSIIGPRQFTLDGSLSRVFRLSDRLNLDVRFDATNLLNHVTYVSWVTSINSAQFGFPTAANAMRSIQTTVRLRF